MTRRHQLPPARTARARAGSAVLCTQIYTEKESVCVHEDNSTSSLHMDARSYVRVHAWKPLRVRTHVRVYVRLHVHARVYV